MLRSITGSGEQGAVPSDSTRSSGAHRQEPLPAPRSLICAAVLSLLAAACQSDGRTPLVEMHDTGEPPLQGGLLEAALGKGTYVYTGLSFFRQLPAGVPGAYRLFANLLALGKPK